MAYLSDKVGKEGERQPARRALFGREHCLRAWFIDSLLVGGRSVGPGRKLWASAVTCAVPLGQGAPLKQGVSLEQDGP